MCAQSTKGEKMKKRRFSLKFAALLAAAVIGLTGCGSTGGTTSQEMQSGSGSVMNAQTDLTTVSAPAAEKSQMSDGNSGDNSGDAQVSEGSAAAQTQETEVAEEADSSRKFITTMDIYAETESFDSLLKTINDKIKTLGGYTENSQISNGNDYSDTESRTATLTIRIPADKLDQFISTVNDNANVTSQSKNVQDVTLNYVDLQSHKKALETEQDRLLELMSQATTTEDMIAIEDKLADVRYQLESMESQLRTYDNQINYSTVNLTIDEVERTTPKAQASFWGQIGTGFMEDLYRVGNFLKEFVVVILTHIPTIVILTVVIILIVVIVRKSDEHSGHSAEKRAEALRRKADRLQSAAAVKKAREEQRKAQKADKNTK